MRIAIVSSGRQHLLNLAVELQRLGHDVVFYSMCPPSMCRRFGLKKGSYVSVFWLVLPLVAISRKIPLPRKISKWLTYIIDLLVDYSCALLLKPCDVFIGRWFVGYRSGLTAKKKYGAKVICDIGTKHPQKEKEIVIKSGGLPSFEKSIQRDLKFYEIADKICVPADHVIRSFLEKGICKEKLFKNPYGVDIEEFPPTKAPLDSYDVIFVGNWRTQKGCDLLAAACNKLNLKLIHVGNIFGDCPFPQNALSHHVNAVPQSHLTNFYQQAKVFALPSRSEGLALVQIQAISSGLPIVYSLETGGSDLKAIAENTPFMFEMRDFSVDALCDAIRLALKKADEVPIVDGKRDYLGALRERFSWTDYGKRYEQFLRKLVNK